MAERLYTQRELNSIFKHLSTRTLHHWATVGVLSWSQEEVNGRGRIRLYTLEEVHQAALIDELASNNMPLDTIKTVLERLIRDYGGILENQDSCLVVYKHGAAVEGWSVGLTVAKYDKNEIYKLINPDEQEPVVPVWEYPTVIIVSLTSLVGRVKQLAIEAGVKL